jgi:hypothetical protein
MQEMRLNHSAGLPVNPHYFIHSHYAVLKLVRVTGNAVLPDLVSTPAYGLLIFVNLIQR